MHKRLELLRDHIAAAAQNGGRVTRILLTHSVDRRTVEALKDRGTEPSLLKTMDGRQFMGVPVALTADYEDGMMVLEVDTLR